MSAPESALARLYHKIYDALCGRHPRQRPWHFQWLAIKDLHRALRRVLPDVSGRVLDVGCGQQPYRAWMPSGLDYVGLDVEGTASRADIRIRSGMPWPLADASFDTVLCTQVLEHVADLDHVMGEIARVLKPGGALIVSVPFAYNQHDWPHDYRRLSVPGTQALLDRDFIILELAGLGGVGSTAGILLLNWVDLALSGTLPKRLVKGLALPLWIVLSGMINLAGWMLDTVDRTGAFYGNVFAVARRR